MLEKDFQSRLIKDLKKRYPGCYILKTDADQIQGIPDLLILHKEKWAALECKKDEGAKHRPNQDYRINEMNEMSFASFIYPENKKEVIEQLDELFN